MIRRFELTGDLGIAPGDADGQLRLKLSKKLLLPWLRMLEAVNSEPRYLQVNPCYPLSTTAMYTDACVSTLVRLRTNGKS